MKRKLILQGKTGLTIYLPKKWVDKNELKPGEEVEITEVDNNIMVSSSEQKNIGKTIELNITSKRENHRRTDILNAYRSGFDEMIVNYGGNIKDLQEIINNFIVGFEIFPKGDNNYLIECVAEPDYEDFDKIVQKMFFINLEILTNLESSTITEYVHQVQKYDNLLKRLLTKNMLKIKASFSLWHFLSIQVQIARYSYHLNNSLKRKFNKEEKNLQQGAIEMLKLLQKIYSKKESTLISELQDFEHKIIDSKITVLLKKGDAVYIHYLINICRQIYLSGSPLFAIISLENTKNKKKI